MLVSQVWLRPESLAIQDWHDAPGMVIQQTQRGRTMGAEWWQMRFWVRAVIVLPASFCQMVSPPGKKFGFDFLVPAVHRDGYRSA